MNNETTPVDNILNDIKSALDKCTAEQLTEVERTCNTIRDLSSAPLHERVSLLYIKSLLSSAHAYKVIDTNPVRDFENAACKASPEQIRAVMRDCGIEYNPNNPAASDSPIEALVREMSIVVTRSDAAFATACGALVKQGLRPTFRETRPVAEPYTHEDDLGLALAKLNDEQLAEIERRIGIEGETVDRTGRILDAINAHQYNFFVTVERINAYGIEPEGETEGESDEPAPRGRPDVKVIILG